MSKKFITEIISFLLVLSLMCSAGLPLTALAVDSEQNTEEKFQYITLEELQKLSQAELVEYCREFYKQEFPENTDTPQAGLRWSSYNDEEVYDNPPYTATHSYITAYSILYGTLGYKKFFDPFPYSDTDMYLLIRESERPDTNKKFLLADHFYNPDNKIINPVPSAKTRYRDYLNTAISEMKQGNRNKAMENLGFAIHFIQDICVPQHSNNKTGLQANHSSFENWTANNFETIEVSDSIANIPNESFTRMDSKTPDDLFIAAAWSGYHYLNLAKETSTFRQAAEKTLSNAVIYTILTLYYFEVKT